jgi:hypothetical protein
MFKFSIVPQTRGAHTPIVRGLVVTLKIDYYYYKNVLCLNYLLSHKQGGHIHQLVCGLVVTLKIDYYYYKNVLCLNSL